WPRLVFDAWRRGVPVFCVSARVYPRDVPRYRAVRTWIAPTLKRLAGVLAQNEGERVRFIQLGAEPERCVVAGNLKHLPDDPAPDAGPAMRKTLGVDPDERVVVFGSVHADETDVVATVLNRLEASGVRVIVAPRHASSAGRMVAGLQRRGARVWRRTSGVPPPRWRVLVLDTVGELRQAYAMSTVAVVGGGFGTHGGQNPMEPVRAGVPVIFGPHGEHFADEFRTLAAVAPEARVASTAELSARLHEWLGDEEHRRLVALAQRESLADGAAVASRYLAILAPWLQQCGISVQG
ncbi:MAG: hypothetical protein A3J75_00045, partial [Acidobacteria bacterium RBG_16_68_9]